MIRPSPTPSGGGLLAARSPSPEDDEVALRHRALAAQLLSAGLVTSSGLSKAIKLSGGNGKAMQGVSRSGELERVVALPRRRLDLTRSVDLDEIPSDRQEAAIRAGTVVDLTPLFLRPGGEGRCSPRGCSLCESGKPVRLRPAQSAALWEAERSNGLIGALGCGSGKELLSMLLPIALGSRRPVVLEPASLVAQAHKLAAEYDRHYALPAQLEFVSYTELSHPKKGEEALARREPDILICNEGHALRHRKAARTGRFLRFLRAHPEVRCVFLSGTLVRKSLRDAAHLFELALHKGSPYPGGPHGFPEVAAWASALDPDVEMRLGSGALALFCSDEELAELGAATEPNHALDIVRGAFGRRVAETPGVVITTGVDGAAASLVLRGLYPEVPPAVAKALSALETEWKVEIGDYVEEMEEAPAGDALEISEASRMWMVARQILCGMVLVWDWKRAGRPNGSPDVEWMRARRGWHKFVRETLSSSRKRAGFDSPLLVWNACMAGEVESAEFKVWAPLSKRYRPEPPTVAVWIDDYLVKACLTWAERVDGETMPGGVIWYEHIAFGEALKRAGLRVFGAGMDAELLDAVDTGPTIACSIASHHTGKNLQARSRALVACPPSSGATWQQLISRHHGRSDKGAEADEVAIDFFAQGDLAKAMANAVKQARFLEPTAVEKQKLLYADKVEWPAW